MSENNEGTVIVSGSFNASAGCAEDTQHTDLLINALSYTAGCPKAIT